jgi:hypothetical protein
MSGDLINPQRRRWVETGDMAVRFFAPILGAGVVLVFLFVGVWLIYHGHASQGALIAMIDLVGFYVTLIFYMRTYM